jgi:putative Holliday junction resolvase
MPTYTLAEIKQGIAPGQRIIGLDLGEKTIGVAVSDPALSIATPVTTIKRRKFTLDIKDLKNEMDGRNIGAVILGLPKHMDGSKGARVQSTEQFARNLQSHMEIFEAPFMIGFFDERLSTVAAHRFMIDDFDLSRKKRSAVVDKMAAQFILQGALDALAQF